jgi:uncharacterized protein (UPF0128 family)
MRAVPMKLLAQLFEKAMPAQVTEPAELRKLRVLSVAGHVHASIPLPYVTLDGRWHQDPATVHQVTALGHKVLRYFGPARSVQSFEKDRAA